MGVNKEKQRQRKKAFIYFTMSSTILEQMRLNHEAIESYEKEICTELDQIPTGQKSKVYQQHKINNILTNLLQKSNDLNKLYNDEDELLKDELSVIKDNNTMFSSFYETLNITREYHQKFPNQLPLTTSTTTTNTNNKENEIQLVLFSGEEVYGKYLDLNEYYYLFINLPHINTTTTTTKDNSNNKQRDNTNSHIDYLQYLDMFTNFFYITTDTRHSKAYIHYLSQLYTYLKGFLSRIQPLIDVEGMINEWKEPFLSGLATSTGTASTTAVTGMYIYLLYNYICMTTCIIIICVHVCILHIQVSL